MSVAERLSELVTLYQGDCLDVLRTLPDGAFDAVITDPPYSSGGFTRGDRMANVSTKYQQTGQVYQWHKFGGDNRDQRSWAYWCSLWLSECLRVVRPGGYLLTFTDWRQLPTATDAVQSGGWLWRGILSWDKGPTARAAFPHYFRHQCEYVVWATAGPSDKPNDWPPEGQGCYPGAYSVPVEREEKQHLTGKPVDLMRRLLFCVPPGGSVLDPFAGSGTTGIAAEMEGRKAVLIEKEPHYCDVIRSRMRGQAVRRRSEHFTPDLFSEVPA